MPKEKESQKAIFERRFSDVGYLARLSSDIGGLDKGLGSIGWAGLLAGPGMSGPGWPCPLCTRVHVFQKVAQEAPI